VRSFTDSESSDTDNIAPFENITSINLINLLCVLLFWLIGVVFSNDTMLSMSDKCESVNKHTHTDQQKIKFHILGFAGSADELITQSANYVKQVSK